MAAINKVMLIGNLGKDPEIRYTPDGLAIVNFSIATTDSWKDKKTGEKREKTEWHRIVAFGKLGEICGEWLTKGKQVYIEGKLQTRTWDKDGEKRYITEIVANEMKMLGSAAGNKQAVPQMSPEEAKEASATIPAKNSVKDDIPF